MKALVTSVNIEPDVYCLRRYERIVCGHLCVFMWFYFFHFLNSVKKKYRPTSLSKKINMTQTRTFDSFSKILLIKLQLVGKVLSDRPWSCKYESRTTNMCPSCEQSSPPQNIAQIIQEENQERLIRENPEDIPLLKGILGFMYFGETSRSITSLTFIRDQIRTMASIDVFICQSMGISLS